jgi:hypothetical protein
MLYKEYSFFPYDLNCVIHCFAYVLLICWKMRLLVMHCFVCKNTDWCMLKYYGCVDLNKLLAAVCDSCGVTCIYGITLLRQWVCGSFVNKIIEESIHRHVCVNECNSEDEKTRWEMSTEWNPSGAFASWSKQWKLITLVIVPMNCSLEMYW